MMQERTFYGLQHDLRQLIDTHLFILCPNNSGSTLLKNVFAHSRHTWNLSREGQRTFGFVGPRLHDQNRQLIWSARAEWAKAYADPQHFDWNVSKQAWYAQATAIDAQASVFVEKSPPFIMIPELLQQAFCNTRFVFMVRNPYAMYEGIIRRRLANPPNDPEDPRRLAAWHVVNCLARQRFNIEQYSDVSTFFTYEQLCETPHQCADDIRRLVPVFGDLDLTRQVVVKGMYDEPLRNMNEQQLATLQPQDLAIANEVFGRHETLLQFFGYGLIS